MTRRRCRWEKEGRRRSGSCFVDKCYIYFAESVAYLYFCLLPRPCRGLGTI